MSDPLCLQWRHPADTLWQTIRYSGIPVSRPAKIRIDCSMAGHLPGLQRLIDKISEFVVEVHGKAVADAPGPLIAPEEDECLLEVLVSDGLTPFPLEDRIRDALTGGDHLWVLPLMPQGGTTTVLPEEVRKQNIAFWHNSVDELALTVLARAGVTSLDRRVFISYRRVDTEPMAGQLFEALTQRNFRTFLDTVSVDPGVDFQSSLFEQLADKSMVVMLHSKTFARSRWTMAELTYAREHELSILILRLPDLEPNDPLEQQYRAGDVVRLEGADLQRTALDAPWQLTGEALARIIAQILEQHDREMINRLALLRQRTLEALQINQVVHQEAAHGSSIFAQSDTAEKTYRLFPASRPPGLPELFDASIFQEDTGERRIVVGHISAFNEQRVKQLDWTVDGRNVAYADVSMLDALALQIKQGKL